MAEELSNNLLQRADILPPRLRTYLESEKAPDPIISYMAPEIIEVNQKRVMPKKYPLQIGSVHLPCRISQALIPYPEQVRNYILTQNEDYALGLHSHHYSHLNALFDTIATNAELSCLRAARVTFDINYLKQLAQCNYSTRADLVRLFSTTFAKSSTEHELSLVAMKKVTYPVGAVSHSPYYSLLLSLNRLRMMIASHRLAYDGQVIVKTEVSEQPDDENGRFTMYPNFTYSYLATDTGTKFVIVGAGQHYAMWHRDHPLVFIGSTTYLDYIYTIADVCDNMMTIISLPNYSWLANVAEILLELASSSIKHNALVDFMKTYEAYILLLADYDPTCAMNWKPFLEITNELWKMDVAMTGKTYEYIDLIGMIHGTLTKTTVATPLIRLTVACKKLTRIQLMEISALHKFIFYAEVDSTAGIKKFLKRVHTKRVIDKVAVKNITRLAKREFLLSYNDRHKTIPTIKGRHTKVIKIRELADRNKLRTLEVYPLSWWDEVTIWNCMDNISTNDALEFAKDKGALKSVIRHGPGDSRKELLQVIEKADNEIKDFFFTKKIVPLRPRVTLERSTVHGKTYTDPCRLIEKEREQKIEARLFANAELTNKHSLSVVALKAKKVLGYFTEQLMTPTDKQRKEIIHGMSQELLQPNRYSMLLDIEGHNQSMQYENTSELVEFIGNLYGRDGWGELPNYFSMLHVYHYNEYTDEVMTSEGQLGGIEGWLNPVWTLHTTLMMKLMRIMEDVELISLAVYSDDVNGIFNIRQASESSIQALFEKITGHCRKFGMIVKISQTALSKHRVTMLRQHYADGQRADSTLKRILSVSSANNQHVFSEELEVSGISSSASSALELSNNHEVCSYVKNYKYALLLARLPHTVLRNPIKSGMLAEEKLPIKIGALLYQERHTTIGEEYGTGNDIAMLLYNDMVEYCQLESSSTFLSDHRAVLNKLYHTPVAMLRLKDNGERMLYYQLYDKFLQELLFFWIYLPTALGGLGGSLHINLVLSGHSSGFMKSVYYLHSWIVNYSNYCSYFLEYLEQLLSVNFDEAANFDDTRLLTTAWPSDTCIVTATTMISSSIRSMVIHKARNESVLKLITMSEFTKTLASQMVEVFRLNFHPRIAQFYYENSAVHFLDLLLNKVETSSGLLTYIHKMTKLRIRLASNTYLNIRTAASHKGRSFGALTRMTDITEYLILRRAAMFPRIKIINIDEPLYDHRMMRTFSDDAIINVRKTSPSHYDRGIEVYDKPDIGNETLYKGDIVDNDRMLGSRVELLCAKLCAVTKWFLTKNGILDASEAYNRQLDIVRACDLSLATICTETLRTLWLYSPTETGGEILHRIPNLRFTTTTYIRAELNLLLRYTTDIIQKRVNDLALYDSNINFDYLRLRLKLAIAFREKTPEGGNLVVRYKLIDTTSIHDVQHIAAKSTRHIVVYDHVNYATYFNVALAPKRLRYMAASYLHTDNNEDLIIGPNLENDNDLQLAGDAMMNTLIYNYAQNLNRNYMLYNYTELFFEPWQPLIKKLKLINNRFSDYTDNQMLGRIREGLVSYTRNRVRLRSVGINIGSHDTIVKLLLSVLYELRPLQKDVEEALMLISSKFRVVDSVKAHRKALRLLERSRRSISITLLCDYTIRLLLETHIVGKNLEVNIEATMQALALTELSTMLGHLLDPCLSSYVSLFGMERLNQEKLSLLPEVQRVMETLCLEGQLLDTVVPSAIGKYSEGDPLPLNVTLPKVAADTTYELREISYPSMSTLSQLSSLCDYASMCAKTGAHPSVFASPTGSDSYCAQFGLFTTLLTYNFINKSSRICDLTAGRGDLQYASKVLGLQVTSYGRRDAFSSVYYHPNVDYTLEYDVFDTSTTKFISEYNWIHIDLSFTGKDRPNILDIVLQCESLRLGYSIRLNSSTLEGYSRDDWEVTSNYRHYLGYANSFQLKPYQIYLIGVPCSEPIATGGVECKDSIAFRSIALSFTRLLGPSCFYLRSPEVECNSVTIGTTDRNALSRFLINGIIRDSFFEHKLYLRRYIDTCSNMEYIMFSSEMIPNWARRKLASLISRCKHMKISAYGACKVSDIGNVSIASRPYHEKHLQALGDETHSLVAVNFRHATIEELQVLRRVHPIGNIRSMLNTVINVKQLMPQTNFDGNLKDELDNFERRLPDEGPMHIVHLDYRMATKLLMYGASKGDYRYTVQYALCKMEEETKEKQRWTRIYRLIRLLSGAYDIIVDDIQKGMLDIRHVNAVVHSLEVGHGNMDLPRMLKRASREEPVPFDFSMEGFGCDFDMLAKVVRKRAIISDIRQTGDEDPTPLFDEFTGKNEVEVFDSADYFSNIGDLLNLDCDLGAVENDVVFPDGADMTDYL